MDGTDFVCKCQPGFTGKNSIHTDSINSLNSFLIQLKGALCQNKSN
jgi:hypothetical protein